MHAGNPGGCQRCSPAHALCCVAEVLEQKREVVTHVATAGAAPRAPAPDLSPRPRRRDARFAPPRDAGRAVLGGAARLRHVTEGSVLRTSVSRSLLRDLEGILRELQFPGCARVRRDRCTARRPRWISRSLSPSPSLFLSPSFSLFLSPSLSLSLYRILSLSLSLSHLALAVPPQDALALALSS